MPIEWPVYFMEDDSKMWRDLPYDKRMEMITWLTHLNFNLIKED